MALFSNVTEAVGNTPLISLSRVSNVLAGTVLGKLETNEHRYPAAEFRGRFRRPERERDGRA